MKLRGYVLGTKTKLLIEPIELKYRIFKIPSFVQLRPQGGVRGPKIMIAYLKDLIKLWKMLKTKSKILFLASDKIFWKSRFTCNYSTCQNLKSRYPKIASMYLLEKTTQPTVLKLGLYLLWVNIYRFFWGFEKFYFFRILWAKNYPKMAVILDFWAFRAFKILKK